MNNSCIPADVNRTSSDQGGVTWLLRRWSIVGFTAVALTVSGLGVDQGALAKGNSDIWVGTWATSPQIPSTDVPEKFENQTIRQIVHTSIGGSELRVRFSNSFGTESLTINAASIGIRAQTAEGAIVPGTLTELTFGGEAYITIPPGARVFSDPVDLDFKPEQDLAISLYVAEPSNAWTIHRVALQTAYISPPGDYTSSETMPAGTTTSEMSYWLTGVDVVTRSSTKAIVTLGDSITDGTRSTVNANARWPNQLARRLNESRIGPRKVGVLDEGISGNRILHDISGQNALARLDRDVLTQSGIAYVVLLEGINDIGYPEREAYADQKVTAEDIIGGYKQIIERAHTRGLKIFGGTLLPYKGAGYYSDEGELKRQAVNDFIRNSEEFDGVIDFDTLMRNPYKPLELRPEYNSGDNLHPNDTGYKAMGNFVFTRLFGLWGLAN